MNWMIDNATGIAGVIGLCFVVVQLFQANKQLKGTTLTNVLSLEAEMNSRKEKIDNINHEIEMLNADKKLTAEMQNIHEKSLEAAIENFLNSVERLCFCIKKGYLNEKEWKAEYRDLITGVVKTFEDKFGKSSKYTNIIDINDELLRK
jgi:molecular chaperone GrpE (heat shock protein)